MKTKTKQQDSIKNQKENENTLLNFFIQNAWEIIISRSKTYLL